MMSILKYIVAAVMTLMSISATAVNPQYTKFLNLKYRDNCQNFTPGDFQSISGKFDGKTIDTITLFPFDGEYDGDVFVYDKWIIISKQGSVPSTVIESYWPELIFEGDLDRNGRDEFGVLLTGQNGYWCTYKTYTLHNRKVVGFAEAQWWLGNEDPLEIIMSRGGSPGEVIIKSYGWTPDMSEIVMKNTRKRIVKFRQ